MSSYCTFLPPNTKFEPCCKLHDEEYWFGEITRKESDKRLRECVAAKGHPIFAWFVWAAVRVFGHWHWVRYRKPSATRISRDGFQNLHK